MKKEISPKRRAVFIISVCVFIICIFLLVLLFFEFIREDRFDKYKKAPSESSENSSVEKPELPDNPIDFEALYAQNSDIYAWIKLPDTQIDYPILQHKTDDFFYLDHDYLKKSARAGAIYTEMQNNTDFSDPNTVIYGHDMRNGTMFQNLLKFRNADFFNQNRYFYIYTPGHILTYDIFSAYRFDDRHLLNSFNFRDPAVFAEYIEMARNPKSLIVNTRPEVNVGVEDKIVTLSTCIGNDNYRYLVQGVLIKDEPTK